MTTMPRNKIGKSISLLLLILGLVACGHQTIYHHYEHVSPSGWDKNDVQTFSVPAIQEAGRYHEEVELRISNDFPFLGLTLVVEQAVFPSGEKQSYTLDCSLVDESGMPKGQGVSYYQYQFPLTDIELNEGDSLQIRILHNMKREIMPGVSDIGISLRKE